MTRIAQASIFLAATMTVAIGTAAVSATAGKAAPKNKAKTTQTKAKAPAKSIASTKPKRYASSVPKPVVKPAVKAPVAPPPASKKPAVPVVTAANAVRRPVQPAINAQARLKAHDVVFNSVANAAEIPVENAVALVPFFEQLYRHQKGELKGPVKILHYGDSHTAADEWTGDMRTRFQERFGDGGSGYSLAGRPYAGYRRMDVRSGSTRGWHTDGLVGRAGDGVYGLGGVSMSTTLPHEAVYLEADAATFELFYYRQPGGGSLQLFDNGMPGERIPTDGEAGPGYYRLDTTPGQHKFELETLDRAPVRLFGWVADNATGVTYETLGINGASASIVLDWNEPTLRSNLEHRDPALIVLAYGTNEAGQKDWTLESYREMFTKMIAEFRAAAPAATILVIGPPDRQQKMRTGWVTMDKLDMIIQAQREAAIASGCPFWDLRAKMGGKGSMLDWVRGSMAQPDHVHFTGPGYRLLGDAIFRDVMSQYDVFLKAREEIIAASAGSPPHGGN